MKQTSPIVLALLAGGSAFFLLRALTKQQTRPRPLGANAFAIHEDGRKKEIDPSAAKWFAHMVHAETHGHAKPEDAHFMVWTLINRQALWKFWEWEWERYIRGYSQPISPAWQIPNGSKCRKYWQGDNYIGSLPDSHPCAPRRALKRRELLATPLDSLHPVAVQATIDVLEGRVPNPTSPGTVGWFGKHTWEGRESNGVNARDGLQETHRVRGNVFYKRVGKSATSSWPGDKVTLAPGSQVVMTP